jgi:hypothetical protein
MWMDNLFFKRDFIKQVFKDIQEKHKFRKKILQLYNFL